MSERLTARSIETLRNLTESFPYNTFPNMLLVHIDALEAENTRLKAQVEAADVLAGAGVALHERLRHVLNVLEGKETRILPGPDIVEARRVLQQSHLEHMHALDAYRATATEDAG